MNPVLVTGAGGQIAARTLAHLLERGHRVVAWVRKPEDRQRLLTTYPRLEQVVVADLSRSDQVQEAVQGFSALPGGWIHLAGMYRGGVLHMSDPAELDLLMRINVGTFVPLARALLPRWSASSMDFPVQVIVLGAASGLEGAPGAPFYAASKAALRVLVRSLDRAYAAQGIRFGILNLMHPADTAANASLPPEIPRISLNTLARTLAAWVEGQLGHLQEHNLYA